MKNGENNYECFVLCIISSILLQLELHQWYTVKSNLRFFFLSMHGEIWEIFSNADVKNEMRRLRITFFLFLWIVHKLLDAAFAQCVLCDTLKLSYMKSNLPKLRQFEILFEKMKEKLEKKICVGKNVNFTHLESFRCSALNCSMNMELCLSREDAQMIHLVRLNWSILHLVYPADDWNASSVAKMSLVNLTLFPPANKSIWNMVTD